MNNTTQADDIDGRYAWTRLVVSVLIATIGSVGMWSIVVVLPMVQAEFGVDRADASLAYTTTMVGFAIGNVWLGRFVDRAGSIFLPLVAAAAALVAGFGLGAMVSSIWVFALLQGLIGFGASATFGPLIADLSHWFVKRRGVAVAAAASGNYFAGAIWPLAMQLTLPGEGWRYTYGAIAIFCLVTMVPLAFLLRRPSPHLQLSGSAPVAAPSRSIDLSPRALQILLSIAGVGCCVAMAMPQVHIVAYCVDLGYGVARGSEMLSLMLVGGIVCRLASGFIADYIGGVKTLLIGSVAQCLALFAYIPFDGLASLYVVSFVFGLAQGGIVPSYAIIVREYLPAREAGQRVGLVIMATIVGMAVGGWMSGWIYDMTGSYAAAFWNGIAWNVLNIAIMAMILLRTAGPKPARPRQAA
jgi:MFS family permease